MEYELIKTMTSLPDDDLLSKAIETENCNPTLKTVVNTAYAMAQIWESAVKGTQVLDIQGMSGQKNRHFLNNVCRLLSKHTETRYLEIGSWFGSTLIAAAYENTGKYVGIDNFIGFGGSKLQLEANAAKFAGKCDITLYDEDCWKIDLGKLPQDINVYFYDGDHSEKSQEDALTYFLPALAKEFILIVDDWNGHEAIQGTTRGLRKNNLIIEHYLPIPMVIDPSDPGNAPGAKHWWAGLGVFILKKP